jgi:prolyl-tRNA editing enzyme YbaK/EbsC (Cys-tRNA(Pro) deacylase)
MDHPGVELVTQTLRTQGARGVVRVLPDSARTAAEAASALGVEIGAIVNSLVFEADGQPVLILTSGSHRVDVDLVADRHDLPPLRRATPEFVRTHTGQAIGGVAPVGHPTPLRTLIDEALSEHSEIWAAAGHPHAVFPTTYDELIVLTGGTTTRVG